MAKNYSISEAAKIIAEGTDIEAIADIGRRYPVLAVKLAKASAGNTSFAEFMGFMPEFISANKVNKSIISGIPESDGADETEADTEESTEKETKSTKPAKTTKANDDEQPSLEEMTGKQLYEIVKEKGLTKKIKSTKKEDMIAAIKAAAGDSDSNEAETDEDEGDESENPYEGKSAMELFKLCKKRGIKVEAKLKAKAYIDALTKADAKDSDDDGDAEEENWEEDEEDTKSKKDTKSTKSDKKANTAKSDKPDKDKKSSKKSEADDEDWDI